MDVAETETSENIAPLSVSKGKNGSGKVSKDSKALAPHNSSAAGGTGKTKKGGKSIEETYQKLSQLEHILLRPDTYIGSTEKQPQQLWVHDGEKMVLKTVNMAPGLYKIFDEILVNAADNKVRDPTMDTLRVDIDEENGEIRVLNNGAGVPVEIHKTEGIYVPELIFGNLLTSSNYNDKEKKVTGGRNGYGAKLANIFSTQFIVETCDGKRKRRYKQVFKKNMTEKGAPQINECKASDNWTCISFQPELERFGMESLEDDTISVMRKRVYDMAGVLGKGVKVYLNGEKLPVKDFQSYVDLYLGPKDAEEAVPRIYERFGDRWEICMAASDGQFNQVSFVNSICTSKGGTHVNYLADQVVKYVTDTLGKKHKQAGVKPFMVRNYIWIFVNCLIENPAFDSQTKDTLTLRASAFGSKCELPDAYLKKVSNSGITDAVLNFANFKANKELKKGDGAKRQRLTGIPKLDDANDAGGKNSQQCTLILTEGDSAKSLAISGLSVVGRDRYGVFPLRGKLLNVREASAAQITANAEIQNIKQILGLQHGKNYTDTKSLRYGHLMIMTDQDHDGSHIKGLIMNYFHTFYPSLLKIPGFLVEFITPIIKVTKGKESIAFFTMPEYENWKETCNTRGWKVKYYKGLGTSTSAEAKDYFSRIDSHRKQFCWSGDVDGNALEMAFSKKKIEERKDWLRSFVPGTYLDHSESVIKYHDFVNRELILFSRADLERSIPNVVDGFKPGQRKIAFACFKRNLKSDIKVAQLAGYVAEHSAYHHGEASLMSTIIGLAQDFVGSNNINLLVPQGQFGTRLQGGKDAASPRYIFTRMSNLTRHLFNEADDKLLKYLNEEGQSIEPEWYMPILPTVLVNGAEGIGTGWSTSIPNYNPRDIVKNLKLMLEGKEPEPMMPWYKGFKGTIDEVMTKTGRSYVINGVVSQIDDTTLEISELPIRKWTQDYKEFLEELVKPEGKNATPFIIDYKEYHTDANVRFVIKLSEGKMQEAMKAGLHSKFKLTTKLSIGNMMLFGPDGIIKKYDGSEDILREFYHLRMDFYIKRKAALLRASEAELLRISNKVRFILAVVSGEIKLSNRRKADIEADLESMNFDRLATSKKAALAAVAAVDADSDAEVVGTLEEEKSYDYLLSMPLSSLTHEKVESLQSEAEEKEKEVEALKSTTEAEMWIQDLDTFLDAYEEFEEEETRKEVQLARQQARMLKGEQKKSKATKKSKAKGKKKKKNAWSDDDASDDASEDDFLSDEDCIAPSKALAMQGPRGRVIAPPKPTSTVSSVTALGSGKGAKKASSTREEVNSKPASPPPPAEEEMSLVQRMAMRLGTLAINKQDGGALPATGPLSKEAAAAVEAVSKPLTKPEKKTAGKQKKKAIAVTSSEEELSDLDIDSDDEKNFLMLSDEEDVAGRTFSRKSTKGKSSQPTQNQKTTQMKGTGKAKNPAKKKASNGQTEKYDSDSSILADDEVLGMSDAESGHVSANGRNATARAPRRAARSAKVTYIESGDEAEEEDISEFDASASESEDDYCPSD